MFLHELNVLKKIGFFGGAVPRHTQNRPPEPPPRREPAVEEQFSAELFELVARNVCLGHPICLKTVTREFEREIITYVLGVTHWNQKKAAEILGVKQTTLNYWVHQFGLAPGRKGDGHLNKKDLMSAESRGPKDGIPRT